MKFLLLLSLEVKKLYSIYEKLLSGYVEQIKIQNQIKHTKTILPKNILSDLYPSILNICRNIIKNYGDQKEKQDIEKIFKSRESTIQRKTSRSPIQNKKNKKQSKSKFAYRVSNETLKDIRKRHFKD
jgi:hypothetical protein